MKLLVMLILTIGLAGCVTTEQVDQMVAHSKPATPEERRIIVNYVRNTFKDPYSIRDAQISYFFDNTPRGGRAGCLSLNAKNSFGAYIGVKYTSIVIDNGRVVRSLQDAPGCFMIVNSGIKFQKFPELEAL
ncbi:hypothetical protein [Roseibium sp. RKSG952]|uniref:hypothetical protein n=1 Tax=Roseibium sp. RKSG952 TaxID=2529384 RepID=UPI0012BC1E45|nr:hypothetical protein [Roseibium sp. RKSG952]MTH96657.1 hypothetical protein [Roseibium sp. RKSG952]